jgi:GNAT superfamily N-acetyltransferase
VSDTAPAVFEFRVERADALTGRALLDAYLSDLGVRIDGFDEARSVSAAPDEMAPPGGAFLVGYLAGRPVSCGGIKDRGDATAEVKRMWVAPEARRRGLGRRLLAALEEAARRRPRPGRPRHVGQAAGGAGAVPRRRLRGGARLQREPLRRALVHEGAVSREGRVEQRSRLELRPRRCGRGSSRPRASTTSSCR